jgi:hypothetical protein
VPEDAVPRAYFDADTQRSGISTEEKLVRCTLVDVMAGDASHRVAVRDGP